MKHYHKNPRQITRRQFEQLKEWLAELGDLGGIVHDLNSDECIGGNQRVRAMGLEGVEPVITERFDPPNAQGTVALGYYEINGERYGYRAVHWTPEQCEKANIVANKGGGGWDWDVLANEWDVGDLLEWGFSPYELGIVGDGNDIDELWQGMPEFENEDNFNAVASIKVHFQTEEAVVQFGELVKQTVTMDTNYIWYPKLEKENLLPYKCKDES